MLACVTLLSLYSYIWFIYNQSFSCIRTDYVNTDVLSAKVLGVDEGNFQNLTEPVIIVFEHKIVRIVWIFLASKINSFKNMKWFIVYESISNMKWFRIIQKLKNKLIPIYDNIHSTLATVSSRSK